MGLIGFLKAQLGIPKAGVKPVSATPLCITSTARLLNRSVAQFLKMQLYGPAGLRAFVRTILNMTDSKCQDKYVVHELLRPGEQPSAPCLAPAMRDNEMKGRDILCGEDGFWRECVRVRSNRARRDIVVDVGQVIHRGKRYSESSLIAFCSVLSSPMFRIRYSRISYTLGRRRQRRGGASCRSRTLEETRPSRRYERSRWDNSTC